MSEFPADLRARIVRIRDSKPLHLAVLHAPRKLTFDMVPVVTLRTLREFVDFILDSKIPDDVTRVELANYVITESDKVSAELASPIILNGPAAPQGSVSRPNRTDDEIRALLADPNLPLDVRNTFEAQLNLPITPPPANIRRASIKALPQVFDEKGELIPYSSFEIDQDAGGTTRMVWKRDDVVIPSKIVTGAGQEVPLLPGFALRKNANVTLPFSMGRGPGKVTALGVLFRNGKVIRDVRTPETDAADALSEAEHRAETVAVVKMARAEGKSDAEQLALVMGRSYRKDEAEQFIAEIV